MSVARIAEKAGVSIATVSRVLNNSRRVQPEVAEQVRKAAAELGLGLRPRAKARAKVPRAQAIGLITIGQGYQGWLSLPVMASVVAEVMRVAEQHEMAVHVAEMPDPEKLCPVVQRKAVDGALVFIPSGVDPAAATTLGQALPIVRVMGAQFGACSIDHIGPDNFAVGHLAAEYLLSRGWRRLAFLTFTPDWKLSQMRSSGFNARAAEAGVIAESFLVDASPAVCSTYGANAHVASTAEELIDRVIACRPAGLFVNRDEDLVEVYRLLARRGVRPGEDLHVIGCDNERARLSMLEPRPTSIDLGPAETATRAVRRLLGRLRNPDEPAVRILVAPRLALPPDDAK